MGRWPISREEWLARFGDLPFSISTKLIRAGYLTRKAVAEAGDVDLYREAKLGPKMLEQLRRKIPPDRPSSVCQACNGRGTLYDDAAAPPSVGVNGAV
jgi:hypothetical protein